MTEQRAPYTAESSPEALAAQLQGSQAALQKALARIAELEQERDKANRQLADYLESAHMTDAEKNEYITRLSRIDTEATGGMLMYFERQITDLKAELQRQRELHTDTIRAIEIDCAEQKAGNGLTPKQHAEIERLLKCEALAKLFMEKLTADKAQEVTRFALEEYPPESNVFGNGNGNGRQGAPRTCEFEECAP